MYSRRRLKQFRFFGASVWWMSQFCWYEITLILHTCWGRIYRLLTLCFMFNGKILGISSNYYRIFTTVLESFRPNFFSFSKRIYVSFISLPLSDILVQFAAQSMNSTFLLLELSSALLDVKLLLLAIFISYFNLFFTLNSLHSWVWFGERVQIFVNGCWNLNFGEFCSLLIHKILLTLIVLPWTLNSYHSRIHQWIFVRNSTSILIFFWSIHRLFV